MLPACFEYQQSESFGTVVDRGSAIQLAARKYALAPYLTVVNMLRSYYNPIFDPSRNPVYQSMVDMLPGGDEESGGAMSGVLDIFAFAMAPGGMMKLVEVGYNSTLFTKSTAHRMLMQMKAISYITAYQATQGAHVIHTHPLPKYLPDLEGAHNASSNACLGSFPLKIHGSDQDERNVSLVSGFELKGTPDEYDFFRRSKRFAMHSGVMPTTDVGHPKFAPQYQIPPKLPQKKKGQAQAEIILPEVVMDDSYEKSAPNPDWRSEDSKSLASESCQLLQGVVETYDAKNGFGMISCDAVSEPIPFFKMGIPIASRPTKKQHVSLRGKSVAFSFYVGDGHCYATALRFLES
jgi:hypothetical protein